LEVFQLPPYWPELNATERIWNYVRKYVTHDRFFERPKDLCNALFSRFDYVRHHPQEIENLLYPFFDFDVALFMRAYIGAACDCPTFVGVSGRNLYAGTACGASLASVPLKRISPVTREQG
jgi:hypothetical protein